MTTEDGYQRFFDPLEVGGETRRDVITNEEILDGEPIEFLDKDEAVPQLAVKRYTTYQQIRLGKILKDTDYWVASKEKISYWKDQPFEAIPGGYYNYFISKQTLKK